MPPRRKTAAQARDQGANDQGAPAPNVPQEAQNGPQEATNDPGRPDAPPTRARGPGGLALPPAPRNFRPETRTIEQARAELGPDEFLWPYAGPVHGITGFSKLAGWKQQQVLGGEREPEELLGNAPNALLILITQAKQMSGPDIVQNALIAEHKEFGNFYLRCVRLPGEDNGFLMGIVDDQGATYSGCEYYDSLDDVREAWRDWTRILNN